MRKTNIALLVAVVSSPLALAEGYYDPYNPYPTNDTTVTDSFNKDIDKTLTVNYDKDLTVKDSFNSDDDYMLLYDVNNKDVYEFTDNSKYDNSQDWTIKIEDNYYVASSELSGAVTYSDVTYGGACCDSYGYDYGHDSYGQPAKSTINVTQTNTMSGAFGGASGINIAGQNAGNNSLVQQSASTNAMITGQ